MRGVAKALFMVGVIGVVITGCGRGDGVEAPPDPGPSMPPAGNEPGGTPAPSMTTSTEQPLPADGTCHSIDVSGAPRIMDQMATALPTLNGGTVTDGMYVLARYEWYDKNARLSQRQIVMQIVNGGRTARYYWQRNDEPAERVVATIFTEGTKISFRGQCPSGRDLEWDRYSVTSDGLVLFSTRDTKTATFTRR